MSEEDLNRILVPVVIIVSFFVGIGTFFVCLHVSEVRDQILDEIKKLREAEPRCKMTPNHTNNQLVRAFNATDPREYMTADARESRWQPISTAPTNTAILIYLPKWEHYGPGIYRAILVDMGTGKRWHSTAWSIGRDLLGERPTHWQPLPEPPTEEQSK